MIYREYAIILGLVHYSHTNPVCSFTAIISSRPYPPSGSNRDDNCGSKPYQLILLYMFSSLKNKELAKTPMTLDYVDPILDDDTLCGEDIQYLFSGLKGASSSRHSIIMNEHLDEEENMFLKGELITVFYLVQS